MSRKQKADEGLPSLYASLKEFSETHIRSGEASVNVSPLTMTSLSPNRPHFKRGVGEWEYLEESRQVFAAVINGAMFFRSEREDAVWRGRLRNTLTAELVTRASFNVALFSLVIILQREVEIRS